MNDLQPIASVLSYRTVYQTPPIFSPSQGILSNLINFPTLNEDYVIQRTIQEYQERKSRQGQMWRFGAAAVGLLLGLGDGFQVNDLLGAVVAGSVGGQINEALQSGDEATLRALNLEWMNSPDSYVYHRKRHRGDAVRRLLLILPHPETGGPTTTFAVQFPDGYVASLAIVSATEQLLFTVTDHGFDSNWVTNKQVLGYFPTDVGHSLPVEMWTGADNHLIAIPYQTPHQYLY